MVKKTDNSHLAAKLALRWYFLRKYHAVTPPQVLDCCQGSGVLWGRLRTEFAVASYWGLDEKPKKGRLKIDSARVLAQPGWSQDVIDVDTYGSPWKHWAALLPHVQRPLTVFLTLGMPNKNSQYGGGDDRHIVAWLGLPPSTPKMLKGRVGYALGLAAALAQPARHGLAVVECVEAVSDSNARYIGVRLEPAPPPAGPALATSPSGSGSV